jgi:hypothetical protein
MLRSHDDTVWVFVLALFGIAWLGFRIGALHLSLGWMILASIKDVLVAVGWAVHAAIKVSMEWRCI